MILPRIVGVNLLVVGRKRADEVFRVGCRLYCQLVEKIRKFVIAQQCANALLTHTNTYKTPPRAFLLQVRAIIVTL